MAVREKETTVGFFQDQKNVFPKLNKVRLRNSTWAAGARRLLLPGGALPAGAGPRPEGPPGEATGHLNFSRPKQLRFSFCKIDFVAPVMPVESFVAARFVGLGGTGDGWPLPCPVTRRDSSSKTAESQDGVRSSCLNALGAGGGCFT